MENTESIDRAALLAEAIELMEHATDEQILCAIHAALQERS